ncbi:MAG: M50 family metallopeptidase [Christensenella sp.]|nr:M50 family metallopeptidase [Christensenella sp.]
MQIFINIVLTLLVLTVLVVAHEYGHYVVAKRHGIKVSEFAIGFGPKLIKWNKNGTEFSIRPIFIGGYNKFADDEEKDPVPGDFRAASLKSRFLTIIAGPAMNIVVAVILSAIFLMAAGDGQAVVQSVEQGSSAQVAGIQEGDIIRSYNGVKIDLLNYDWAEAQKQSKGDSLPLIVERDGETLTLDVPYEQTDDGAKQIGINLVAQPRSFNFFESIALSFKWLFVTMGQMLAALGNLFFQGQGIENMAGIVGVVGIVGQAVSYGWVNIISLAALLSVNLAIINLLPIPALDGGKVVLYAVEGIRKKPASAKVEGILNMVGMVLIFGLAIFLVFQDIGRLM